MRPIAQFALSFQMKPIDCRRRLDVLEQAGGRQTKPGCTWLTQSEQGTHNQSTRSLDFHFDLNWTLNQRGAIFNNQVLGATKKKEEAQRNITNDSGPKDESKGRTSLPEGAERSDAGQLCRPPAGERLLLWVRGVVHGLPLVLLRLNLVA